MNHKNILIKNTEANIASDLSNKKLLKLDNFDIRKNSFKYFHTIGNNSSNNFNLNKNIKEKKTYNKSNRDHFYFVHKFKKFFTNKSSKEKKERRMSEILDKLNEIKKKLNEIKGIESRKKINNIRLFKPSKIISKSKSTPKSNTKNKYLLYINDYYKNKKQLLLEKNKNLNLETEINNDINKEENKLTIDEKKDINDESKSKTELINILEPINMIKSFSNMNEKRIDKKILSFDGKINNVNNLKKKSIIKSIISNCSTYPNSFYFNGKKKKIENNNKIANEHIKYIEIIKEKELMSLINRYKKTLHKNKNEEILHFKSLVFPPPLINYLIELKKDLTITKYRNEYINKLERYNSHKVLRVLGLNDFYVNRQPKIIFLK